MKISLKDVSSEQIGRTIARLEKYAKKIDRDATTLAHRLALSGQMMAKAAYATDTNYQPREDAFGISVTAGKVQNSPNTYRLKASGKAVAFLEFGAGVAHNSLPHPFATTVTPKMGPGTYPGKGHWDDPGGWYVPGTYDPAKKASIKTDGNEPTMAMFQAYTKMNDNIEQFAKEVFK